MDQNKIAFIICSNDDLYLSECINYISALNVPDQCQIEIITIKNATSITMGYQSAMNSTNAKYKVYLHQDVFIINKNFIFDILNIFESDSSIGLIGMVGYKRISPTAVMWKEPRVGISEMYGSDANLYQKSTITDYTFNLLQDGIEDVALIDGLMMVTAFDIDWNTTEIDGWDFYDFTQSIHFLQSGYRVICPNQTIPWFIHDDGAILSPWNYNRYRQLCINRYGSILGKYYYEIINDKE